MRGVDGTRQSGATPARGFSETITRCAVGCCTCATPVLRFPLSCLVCLVCFLELPNILTRLEPQRAFVPCPGSTCI